MTLASLFPIITVLLLGAFYIGTVPEPEADPAVFFAHEKASNLFDDEQSKLTYLVKKTDETVQLAYIGGLSESIRDSVAAKIVEIRKQVQNQGEV